MASLIRGKGTLVDFGCGEQKLRNHLPVGTTYLPTDYTLRSADTLVIDFNDIERQSVKGDIAFMSGFIEYLERPIEFLEELAVLNYQEIVLSYCLLESVPSIARRAQLGWKNHLSMVQIITVLLQSFVITDIRVVNGNTILRAQLKNNLYENQVLFC